MKGFVKNIEEATLNNDTFRTVLYTGNYMQLVVMKLKAGEEIGLEQHGQDQFIRIESGTGKALLDKKVHVLTDDTALIIPAGTKHNIINSGKDDMKLYTLYAMPHHADKKVHKTKKESERDEKTHSDEFLGETTE